VAHKLAQIADRPVTISIRKPIPLDIDDGTRWRLTSPNGEDILVAEAWEPTFATTTAPDPNDVLTGEANHPFRDITNDLVPECFSCGLQPGTMGVHAGPMPDNRYATSWTMPEWAIDNPETAEGCLWAALDCTAAWYVVASEGMREAYTVQYAVEILHQPLPNHTYSIVAWEGDYDRGWTGRKRGAASAAFDQNGRLVGQARSFWVAPATETETG